MKKLFSLSLTAFAVAGMFFMNVQNAHAVECRLEKVNEGGATAIYDCGEYGKVTVAKGVTVQ